MRKILSILMCSAIILSVCTQGYARVFGKESKTYVVLKGPEASCGFFETQNSFKTKHGLTDKIDICISAEYGYNFLTWPLVTHHMAKTPI